MMVAGQIFFGKRRRKQERLPRVPEGEPAMQTFRASDLRNLLSDRSGPHLSIHLPLHPESRESRQDAIRLKNLIGTAEQKLRDSGADSDTITALLKPTRGLNSGEGEPLPKSQGLAIFASPDESFLFAVSSPLEEACVLGDRFCVTPLLGSVQNDRTFYVLAVSQKSIRLFEASQHTIDELQADALPENLRDALNIDEYQEHLQGFRYTNSGAQGGQGETMYHGHGGADQGRRKNDELMSYFRRIGSALSDYFEDDSQPLVFAGVEYLFPLFKESTDYRGLVSEPVTGNPDGLSGKELHAAAWPLVDTLNKNRVAVLLEQYGDQAARDLASSDPNVLLQAAEQGAIGTLLLGEGAQLWGQPAGDGGRYEPAEADADGAEHVLDRLVGQTLGQSGEIVLVAPDRMPNGSPVAGLFRYPVYAESGKPATKSNG